MKYRLILMLCIFVSLSSVAQEATIESLLFEGKSATLPYRILLPDAGISLGDCVARSQWAAKVNAGTTCETTLCSADFFTTFSDIRGVKMRFQKTRQKTPSLSIRVCSARVNPSKVVQLYNLKDDICESKNLEDQYPEMIRELVDTLAKALHDGRTTPDRCRRMMVGPINIRKRMDAFPELKEQSIENNYV